MTETQSWLTHFFRIESEPEAAVSRRPEKRIAGRDFSDDCFDTGRRRSRGGLLEAVWAAASTGLYECPDWLIAAVENDEENDRT
jgi:hypothetical protein